MKRPISFAPLLAIFLKMETFAWTATSPSIIRSELSFRRRVDVFSEEPEKKRRKRKSGGPVISPANDPPTENTLLPFFPPTPQYEGDFSEANAAASAEFDSPSERQDSMLDDIAEFKRTSPRVLNAEANEQKAGLRKVVGVLGTVLSYNFVIIIGFFLW